MIKKICSRCGKLFSGHSCPDCDKKRNQRYNKHERDQERNAVYGAGWDSARKYVLSRDMGLCRMCYAENKLISANLIHHIVPVEDDSNLWYDHDNLITVCYRHHKKIHDEYNKGEKPKRLMQAKLKAMIW